MSEEKKPTKAEIVQNLLDAHQITPEQAVILLTDSSERIVFIPQPFYPTYPVYPYPYPQFTITC